MGSSRHHKVCFPIAGVPAIVRIIDTLKSAGLKHFLLVVGQQAVDVMETVTRVHPDVSFAYQPEALGTGHAAECAARVLRERHIGGDILITMGDKVIEAQVVRDLVERHRSEAAPQQFGDCPQCWVRNSHVMPGVNGAQFRDCPQGAGRDLGTVSRAQFRDCPQCWVRNSQSPVLGAEGTHTQGHGRDAGCPISGLSPARSARGPLCRV